MKISVVILTIFSCWFICLYFRDFVDLRIPRGRWQNVCPIPTLNVYRFEELKILHWSRLLLMMVIEWIQIVMKWKLLNFVCVLILASFNIVQLLVERRADINAVNDDGYTALSLAFKKCIWKKKITKGWNVFQYILFIHREFWGCELPSGCIKRNAMTSGR